MRKVYIISPVAALLIMAIMIFSLPSSKAVGTIHCEDCPSETCLCIQDVEGNWMLCPEVGDADEP